MHNARDTAAALAVLLALAIGMALPWIASCTPLQRIDEMLWGTAQPEPDTPTTPGGLVPRSPPTHPHPLWRPSHPWPPHSASAAWPPGSGGSAATATRP